MAPYLAAFRDAPTERAAGDVLRAGKAVSLRPAVMSRVADVRAELMVGQSANVSLVDCA